MQHKTILIIGANSAVAQAVSKQLAANNSLYFLARDGVKLERNLVAMGLDDCWSSCVDINDTGKTSELIAKAWYIADGFDLVFIAPGLLGDQLATESDFRLAQQVLQTNFNAVISILIDVSQLLEAQGYGKIAVTSSVAGERGRPRNYTYGAAKAGLSRYLEGLRSRLWLSGVEVYTFKMGPVDTPMTESHNKDFSFSTTDRVASRMIKLLDSRHYCAYVPSFWAPVMWVVRWLPEPIFQRLHFLSGR